MHVGNRITLIYARVSTRLQSDASQIADLEAWAQTHKGPSTWLRDQFTGKSMQRPGWDEGRRLIDQGHVGRVVIWRLDRLGRSARELTALLHEFQQKQIVLVSLREGLDLSTPAGLLVAHVIASVAEYETEIRGERVAAGQAVARAAGKTWGGTKPGRIWRATPEKRDAVRTYFLKGMPIARIARMVSLDRKTVYAILRAMKLLGKARRRRL